MDDVCAGIANTYLCLRSADEKEILYWLVEGKSNEDIGVILEISPLTVKSHVQNIFKKLNVSNRQQAVAVALNTGNTEL